MFEVKQAWSGCVDPWAIGYRFQRPPPSPGLHDYKPHKQLISRVSVLDINQLAIRQAARSSLSVNKAPKPPPPLLFWQHSDALRGGSPGCFARETPRALKPLACDLWPLYSNFSRKFILPSYSSYTCKRRKRIHDHQQPQIQHRNTRRSNNIYDESTRKLKPWNMSAFLLKDLSPKYSAKLLMNYIVCLFVLKKKNVSNPYEPTGPFAIPNPPPNELSWAEQLAEFRVTRQGGDQQRRLLVLVEGLRVCVFVSHVFVFSVFFSYVLFCS